MKGLAGRMVSPDRGRPGGRSKRRIPGAGRFSTCRSSAPARFRRSSRGSSEARGPGPAEGKGGARSGVGPRLDDRRTRSRAVALSDKGVRILSGGVLAQSRGPRTLTRLAKIRMERLRPPRGGKRWRIRALPRRSSGAGEVREISGDARGPSRRRRRAGSPAVRGAPEEGGRGAA